MSRAGRYLLLLGAVSLSLAVLAGLSRRGRQHLAGSWLRRCGNARFGRRDEKGGFAVTDNCAQHLEQRLCYFHTKTQSRV